MNVDVHTLTGAYALDALDDVERQRFERHLSGCAACMQEVTEFRATAARLAAVAAARPPDGLRPGVAEIIATTRQQPPITKGASAGADVSRRWMVRLVAAAAAIGVAAAITLGAVGLHTQLQLDAAQGQIARLHSLYAPLDTILGAQDALVSNGIGVHGGAATVAVSRKLDEAVLFAFDMPPLPRSASLQAWVVGNGDPRSLGLFQPGANGTLAPLTFTGLHGAQEIAVTVEPARGSLQPTTNPMLLFDLPS
jgi:anti-sigma-K factor RskA